MKRFLLAIVLCSSACVYSAIYSIFEMPPPCEGDVCAAITWVALEGGEVALSDEDDSAPVQVSAFEISKNEVTVGEFMACVDAGVCFFPPLEGDYMSFEDEYYCALGATWNEANSARKEVPVNCITLRQMRRFAAWMGGRLPTDAEWLFAATSQNKEGYLYPWGDTIPADPCSHAAVHNSLGTGCGQSGLSEVCHFEAGNSDQGLCDLVGNIAEVVVNPGAVDDGDETSYSLRGGFYQSSTTYQGDSHANDLEVKAWNEDSWGSFAVFAGFRIVREVP
jgi:formylglycine-generating enzyme required for sulfatase activity